MNTETLPSVRSKAEAKAIYKALAEIAHQIHELARTYTEQSFVNADAKDYDAAIEAINKSIAVGEVEKILRQFEGYYLNIAITEALGYIKPTENE